MSRAHPTKFSPAVRTGSEIVSGFTVDPYGVLGRHQCLGCQAVLQGREALVEHTLDCVKYYHLVALYGPAGLEGNFIRWARGHGYPDAISISDESLARQKFPRPTRAHKRPATKPPPAPFGPLVLGGESRPPHAPEPLNPPDLLEIEEANSTPVLDGYADCVREHQDRSSELAGGATDRRFIDTVERVLDLTNAVDFRLSLRVAGSVRAIREKLAGMRFYWPADPMKVHELLPPKPDAALIDLIERRKQDAEFLLTQIPKVRRVIQTQHGPHLEVVLDLLRRTEAILQKVAEASAERVPAADVQDLESRIPSLVNFSGLPAATTHDLLDLARFGKGPTAEKAREDSVDGFARRWRAHRPRPTSSNPKRRKKPPPMIAGLDASNVDLREALESVRYHYGLVDRLEAKRYLIRLHLPGVLRDADASQQVRFGNRWVRRLSKDPEEQAARPLLRPTQGLSPEALLRWIESATITRAEEHAIEMLLEERQQWERFSDDGSPVEEEERGWLGVRRRRGRRSGSAPLSSDERPRDRPRRHFIPELWAPRLHEEYERSQIDNHLAYQERTHRSRALESQLYGMASPQEVQYLDAAIEVEDPQAVSRAKAVSRAAVARKLKRNGKHVDALKGRLKSKAKRNPQFRKEIDELLRFTSPPPR